jgi:hypothetical protein
MEAEASADTRINVICRVRPPNERELAYVRGLPQPQRVACRSYSGRGSFLGRSASGLPCGAGLSLSYPQGATSSCIEPSAGGDISCLGKPFAFDAVCDEKSTQARSRSSPRARLSRPAAQESIFQLAGERTVDALLEGISGCLLAYGQTGAGAS